jgi:hypothetical protein
VQLEFVGQCVDPACIDDGDWATDFPAVTGTLVTPLDCPPGATEAELTACRLAHSKKLSRQARELTAEVHEMFGMPVAQQAEHVLLYPVEASQQLRTMFPDGSLQPLEASPLPLPTGGRRALQSAGPGSQGDVTRVVRRALHAHVVVHATTLAGAQDVLCRAIAHNANASCCLLPGACPAGAPTQCHPLCKLALAEAPADCNAGWFEAWHRPLADLCAAHDLCVGDEALGCGDALSAGAPTAAGGPAGQHLCQRQLCAPPGQRVRLEFTAVDLAPGAFLLAFEGTTEEEELAQLTAGQGAPPGGIVAAGREMLVTLERPPGEDAAHASRLSARVVCEDVGGGH